MKKYKFLVKPVLFIFNLLFASWLVLEIEKLKPSDFGRYKSLFEHTPAMRKENSSVRTRKFEKNYLVNLCRAYKLGRIDSVRFALRLGLFMESAMRAGIIDSTGSLDMDPLEAMEGKETMEIKK